MQSWQSIETAPKDGTIVDLWAQAMGIIDRDSDKEIPLVEFRVTDAYWDGGKWKDKDGRPHESIAWISNPRITHWMPLPPPPSQINRGHE
jgi:hypothetical protein